MLELNKTYSIKEIEDFKDLVTIAYVIIDDIYQEITPTYIKNRRNAIDAILSDSEVITISIWRVAYHRLREGLVWLL